MGSQSYIKLIVLDFDGVVVDGTNDAYIRCYADAISSSGINLPYDLVRARIMENWGKAPEIEIRGVIPDLPDLVPCALAFYESHIDDHLLRAAKPIAGALDAVEKLSRKYQLAVISGMGQRPLELLVDRLNLRDRLIAVISTSGTTDPAQQKHTGYHLNQLMAQHSLWPRDVLCVGDGGSDIAMAKSLGVKIVVVTCGALSTEEATLLGAQLILPSLAGVPDFLEARGHQLERPLRP